MSAISIALCLGIAAGYFFQPPFLSNILFAAFSILLAGLFFRNNRFFIVFILSAALFLGISSAVNKSIHFRDDVSQLKLSYYQKVLLKGVIVDDPKEFKKPYRHDFILRAETVKIRNKIYKIRGPVLVKTYQRKKFSYGQEIIIRGGLISPRKSFGKSSFNYRQHLKTLGIEKIFYSKKNDYVKFIDSQSPNTLRKLAYGLKQRLEDYILEHLNPKQAHLLISMLLGGREYLSKDLKDIFVKTGTVHILAISGLHVGIVAFMILIVLKALNIKFVPRYLIALFLIIFYSILTGLRPSIVRSAVMIGIFIFGMIMDREVDIFNCLAVAAIAILVFNPLQLFNVGFQLSFISVFSICYFAPQIEILVKKRGRQNFSRKKEKTLPVPFFLWKAVIFSASAWLGTWAVVAYYFNIISPITILANIFVVPYMSLILATGFSFVVMGQFHPIFACSFAASAEFVILALIKWVSFLSMLPYAYFEIKQFNILWVMGYYAAILSIFSLFRAKKFTP